MPLLDLKVVTTHLEVATIRELERIAQERGVSKADVIRDFLKRGQQDWEREQRIIRGLDQLKEVPA